MAWSTSSRRLAALGALASVCGCGAPPEFDAHTVIFEVDYMNGAEPAVGNSPGFDIWSIVEDNARAVLGDDKHYVVPHTLDDMTQLSAVHAAQFNTDDVIRYAQSFRDLQDGDGITTFYVIWLDGKFTEDNVVKDSTLAINVEGTNIIAMFKKAIENADGYNHALLEQVVLVHEVGHAVGFVDDGIPMVDDHRHHDKSGHHCHNEACVMFPSGAKDNAARLRRESADEGLILFDDACLADAAALR